MEHAKSLELNRYGNAKVKLNRFPHKLFNDEEEWKLTIIGLKRLNVKDSYRPYSQMNIFCGVLWAKLITLQLIMRGPALPPSRSLDVRWFKLIQSHGMRMRVLMPIQSHRQRAEDLPIPVSCTRRATESQALPKSIIKSCWNICLLCTVSIFCNESVWQ